jgi:spermidine synthase
MRNNKKLILSILIFFVLSYICKLNKNTYSGMGDYKINISNNIIKLESEGVVYSSFNIKTFETSINYVNKIYDIVLPIKNKKKILLLGFGIGAISMRLSLEEDIDIIDCVEINTTFIKKFKEYFPNYSNKINIIKDDVVHYLNNTSEKYDIIIDDVFIDVDKINLDYNLINTKLNENGIFVSNYIRNDNNLKIKKSIYDSFNCTENVVFHNKNYFQSILNCKNK